MGYYNRKNSLLRANDLKYAAPKPQASKPWHKVVIDIVTALVIIGGLAWFIIATM